MKVKFVVADWNGTMISDTDDSAVLKQIGEDQESYCMKRPHKWGKLIKMVKVKKTLQQMLRQYQLNPEENKELVNEMLKQYNEYVINGAPLGVIEGSILKYGNSARFRMVHSVFESLINTNMNDARLGILSSALKKGIDSALGKNAMQFFWFVDGSELYANSKTADRIELRNYHNRSEALGSHIESMNGINPDNVVYIGDDFKDQKCAEYVGRFVVPPLAWEKFKSHMSSRYGRKVRIAEDSAESVYKSIWQD